MGLARDTDDLGNSDVGCCAIAGPGHFVRWEDAICQRPTRVQAADVLREYSAISGYVPGDESTDVGCYALDVMRRWRKVGLFGTRIEAFAQVDYRSQEELARATFLLGGAFLCFDLPRSAEGTDTWGIVGNDGGTWGRHLVWADGTGLVNSWGQRIRVTTAFVQRYCFDVYAVVSVDSVMPGGRAFSGLDVGGLREALAAVTA
jgi:hypothetical protein